MIPSDSNATVKADSLNGSITNDFGLPVRKGKYVGRDMYGRLGAGDVQIKLSSVNGGLAVGRKNDGRSFSPSTNLLPEKGKDDDDDWDVDVDSKTDMDMKVRIDTAKINKQVNKSVRESQRVAARAAADVNAEMAKVGPEIAKAAADSAAAASAVTLNQAELQRSIQDAVRQQATIARAVNAVFMPGVPKVETKSDSFKVQGVPKVTIDANGSAVKVTGWDRQECSTASSNSPMAASGHR